MNQSLVNIFEFYRLLVLTKSKGGGAPLPARPSPGVKQVIYRRDRWTSLCPACFRGFLCAAIVFLSTQRRIPETFIHTIQWRSQKNRYCSLWLPIAGNPGTVWIIRLKIRALNEKSK